MCCTSSQQKVCLIDSTHTLIKTTVQCFAVGCYSNNNEAAQHRIAFHSQRKNHLQVQLTEVDSFGNYSSPHYKGTAIFYKVTRHQLEWRGDKADLKDAKLLGDPVCMMSLTLPKVQKHSKIEDLSQLKDILL